MEGFRNRFLTVDFLNCLDGDVIDFYRQLRFSMSLSFDRKRSEKKSVPSNFHLKLRTGWLLNPHYEKCAWKVFLHPISSSRDTLGKFFPKLSILTGYNFFYSASAGFKALRCIFSISNASNDYWESEIILHEFNANGYNEFFSDVFNEQYYSTP